MPYSGLQKTRVRQKKGELQNKTKKNKGKLHRTNTMNNQQMKDKL